MKTVSTFFQLKQPLKCVNTFASSCWLWLSSLRQPLSQASTTITDLTAHAVRALLVGLHALRNSLNVNHRLFVGTLIILVVAPLSGIGYQVFDRFATLDKGWFYLNNYYFYLTLAPYISTALALLGVSVLFQKDSRRAYLLILPMGEAIGKIIWLSQITNNDDFHRMVPMYFVVTGALIGAILIFCTNWLTNRKFHQFDGAISRLIGILNSPGITDDKKVKLALTEAKKLKLFSL